MSFLPPQKKINVPENAQWIGGIGAGSWFSILKESKYYQIKRFSPNGILECQGLFSVDDIGFRIDEKFVFTYLSHCSLCTIEQKGKFFKFSLYENQNV